MSINYKTSYRSILIIGCIAFILKNVEAYNEENSMDKWSPRYLFGESNGALFLPKKSRFDRFYSLRRGVGRMEGSFGSRNPGFYSRSLRDDKRSTCVSEGETCLYRSALAGAVIKLRCCKGSFCAFKGNGFICMDNEEIVPDNSDDYTDGDNF